METYKGNTFNGASAVMLKFVAGIAGSNMLAFSSGCGVLARDGVVVAAQSVACLSVGITWIAFAINDSYLATTGQFGDSVPVESVYANSVLFLILGTIAFQTMPATPPAARVARPNCRCAWTQGALQEFHDISREGVGGLGKTWCKDTWLSRSHWLRAPIAKSRTPGARRHVQETSPKPEGTGQTDRDPKR